VANRHWIASYDQRVPAEIDADAWPSMVHLMDAAIARHRDRVALRACGSALSYGEYDAQARAFAAFLQQRLGVQKGDRVAVMLPNVLAFPIAFLGIARAGAVQVNVNPLYTARELEHQLNDAGVEVIVAFSGSTPTLAEIVGKTRVRTVVTVALGDGGATAVKSPPVDSRLAASAADSAFAAESLTVLSFAAALQQGAQLPFAPVDLTGDDLLFLYTGGTTGLSKGAALSHRNLVANTEQFKAFLPLPTARR
jgi:long-chain acyl-CoA synthetase